MPGFAPPSHMPGFVDPVSFSPIGLPTVVDHRSVNGANLAEDQNSSTGSPSPMPPQDHLASAPSTSNLVSPPGPLPPLDGVADAATLSALIDISSSESESNIASPEPAQPSPTLPSPTLPSPSPPCISPTESSPHIASPAPTVPSPSSSPDIDSPGPTPTLPCRSTLASLQSPSFACHPPEAPSGFQPFLPHLHKHLASPSHNHAESASSCHTCREMMRQAIASCR